MKRDKRDKRDNSGEDGLALRQWKRMRIDVGRKTDVFTRAYLQRSDDETRASCDRVKRVKP